MNFIKHMLKSIKNYYSIQKAKKRLENIILYGDTDSIFIIDSLQKLKN